MSKGNFVWQQLDSLSVMLVVPHDFKPVEILRQAEACAPNLMLLEHDVATKQPVNQVLQKALLSLAKAVAEVGADLTAGAIDYRLLPQRASWQRALALAGPVQRLFLEWEASGGCDQVCDRANCSVCAH